MAKLNSTYFSLLGIVFVIDGLLAADNTIDLTPSHLTINIFPPKCDTVKNFCDPNPCKYGGKCVIPENKESYECECPFPTGGHNCQDLMCHTTCFRLDSTVYFIYPYAPSSYDQAYEKCASEGLALAMMKNKSTHESIQQKLLAIFADRPQAKTALWIGLNRSSGRDDWRWTDGSPLDYHDGWTPNRPGGSNCVNIANSETFKFRFDDDNCDGHSGWTFYPFCQMTYPFFSKH